MSNYGSDPGATPPPEQPMQPQPGYQPPDQGSPGQGYPPPQDSGGYVPPQGSGGYAPPQGTGGYVPPQSPGGYVPPQGVPPQGMPTQYTGGPPPAPPRRRPPCLIIGIIVVAVLLVCGIGALLLGGGILGGVLAATQPVADAGDAYMSALRDGDYNKAFSLSSQSLQQEAGNAQGIQTALSSKQPQSWSFTSRNVNNDQGSLSGNTTYKDGSTGTVDLVLVKEGNDWKVAGIHFK